MATQSHWQQTALPHFPPLSKSEQVDVLVVGGGSTGITTAYLLKQAGRSVALVERGRCAQADTGATTAHLTCVTDLRLAALVQRFGRDHAQAVWDGGLAALQQIEEIIAEENIACDLAHVPGHLHASLTGDRDERSELKREADLARELGFEAEFVDSVPIFGRPGVRYPNQAVFHPLKYLAELITRVPGRGSHVYEMTDADEFEVAGSGQINVQACGRVIQCDAVVLATDVPLQGISSLVSAAALQTKITGYTSYAVGATLPKPFPSPACFWDSSDPYYFLRVDRSAGDGYAVFGGLDHKTGQTDETVGRFDRLEEMLHRFLPGAQVDRRWSGQVIESHDGLPFIGETAQRQFIATGFSGNGLTFGTLAAIMIRDAIVGRPNPWRDLFSPDRTPLRGAWNYLVENAEYPYYMVKDRLAASEGQSLSALPRGTGTILRLDGKRVAAYRDDDGTVSLVSPVCTHLGCLVHWNEAERSWDCPCHGSRFDHTGEVITGPAETPLKAIEPR